jgi:predicted RNA-binding Zn-ribbon protein involved in translation (DUF1610 family)
MDDLWLDGNAMAGLLAAALGEDVTATERRCPGCGDEWALGAYRAYRGAGVVLRCPGCGTPGLRVVETTVGFSVAWGADPAR